MTNREYKEKQDMIELKSMAAKLNNSKYRNIPIELLNEAEHNGIAVIYGASDDLMQLMGALYDEFDCFDGGTCYLNKNGEINYEETTPNKINIFWHDDGEYRWTYETTIPHETFDIYTSDGEKYCRGIVFFVSDLK